MVGGLGATSAADGHAIDQPEQRWSLAYSATMQTPGATWPTGACTSATSASRHIHSGFGCMQEHSRSAKGSSTKTCWRAMCTCTSGAHPSRWQSPSSSGAAPWTTQPLEVLLLQPQSGLRALQEETVTMQSRYQSGTGWCTSHLCPTFDLRDEYTLSHAGGVQLLNDATVHCRVRTQHVRPRLIRAVVQPRAQRPVFRQLMRAEPGSFTVADRLARPLLARAHLLRAAHQQHQRRRDL